MQMKERGISSVVVATLFLSLAQAQVPSPRNVVIDLLKEEPPPVPAACSDPVFGPIEWRLGSSALYLSGCDDELMYIVLGAASEITSLNSFRFAFDGSSYDLLLPGPIEEPAALLSSEVAQLSGSILSQMAARLRESNKLDEP